MIRAIGSKIDITSEEIAKEYYDYIKDLLESEKVQEMKKYIHHGDTTCFQHCVNVSFYNFIIAKKLNLNAKAAARAGLLHDLFLYDWHTHHKRTGSMFHGLTHPKVALENAKKYYSISELEEDIIVKHMWPVTFAVPRYKESFLIAFTDKYCGLMEVLNFWYRCSMRILKNA
jgi:uncharacterized protein